MSRPRQWPPRVHCHRGRARVRIDGREHYLGAYGSPEAEREYARLLAAHAAGLPAAAAGNPTVGHVVVAFLTHAGRTYSAEGGQTVRFRQALRPLHELFGPTPAADFKLPQLRALRDAMIARGWCRNHVNRQVVRVRTAWRWAEQEGLVPEGRYHHLRALRCLPPNHAGVRHSEPRRACTPAELEAVCALAPPAVATMLRLQWHTGMRSQEVRLMRACDIDRTGDVWLYRPAKHKNRHRGQDRVVPLGPECQRLLLPWLRAQYEADLPATAYLFRGLCQRRRREGDQGEPGDRPYTTCSYARVVRRCADKAGLPGFHPYQCRHAAKRRLVREHGADGARAVLGQKHIETTLLYDQAQDVETAARVAREAC